MAKIAKPIISRLGTCRSGTHFDIPHELSEALTENYMARFEITDRVDIFCMCEAIIVSVEKSTRAYSDHKSIRMLYRYRWQDKVFAALSQHLRSQGLNSSPDYVRFGQAMLFK
jgi:hypothetical protein